MVSHFLFIFFVYRLCILSDTGSESDARLEAEFCLENIQGLELEYSVCFDIEDKEQLKLNNR